MLQIKKQGAYRLPFTCLYGQIEDIFGYEAFDFDDPDGLLSLYANEQGHITEIPTRLKAKYTAKYGEHLCTLYLWRTRTSIKKLKGLVVLNTDEESITYAEKMMRKKASVL
jgi:hypothetical protein